MGESHQASSARNDTNIYEPIWFHARKVNHGSYFLNKKIMERYREKKDLHMIFIDLEKAYDKIPRNVIWWALDKHKVPTKYVGLIKDMYNNVVTRVRTSDGDTDDFRLG